MSRRERITATGHENVSAEHASTFEVTSEDFLTEAGDCILGIEADRAPAEFDPGFVAAASDDAASITAVMAADGERAEITGRGDSRLTFESEVSLVGRTSEYVDDRTIMVEADAAAADLDRELVAALAAGAELTVELRVE
ncbi:MAG: DUF371 domain-containing protein [Halodesulfurarchaeum sp.]